MVTLLQPSYCRLEQFGVDKEQCAGACATLWQSLPVLASDSGIAIPEISTGTDFEKRGAFAAYKAAVVSLYWDPILYKDGRSYDNIKICVDSRGPFAGISTNVRVTACAVGIPAAILHTRDDSEFQTDDSHGESPSLGDKV